METSNAGRPVPATEEIIENLPREVLEIGCWGVYPSDLSCAHMRDFSPDTRKRLCGLQGPIQT
jgi:hypothetical protein